MRKETMDLGGVTPLIIREFGDGSVKEFTVQLVEKKSDMLLQAVLRNDYGSYVLNLRKNFNRLYFIVNLPLWSAIMSIEENSLNDIMCPKYFIISLHCSLLLFKEVEL